MTSLLYALMVAILFPLSLLPLSFLYLLSDLLYVLAYRIFGYRKAVVYANLKNSFPAKSDAEVDMIAKQFYHNLCDIIVEDIKFLSINRNEVEKRFQFTNPEVLNQHYQKNSSVIMTLGHCGNWELAGIAASVSLQHHSIAIYRSLSNKAFEKLINRIRSRFGLTLVAQDQLRGMLRTFGEGKKLYELITDQTPVDTKSSHWMEFLNQDTPVYMGTEKVAKMTGLPVYYADIKRVKRGYYQATFHEVSSSPKETSTAEITETHTRLLEKSICEQPGNWLWSHRRWKRKRPAESQNLKREKV